MTSVRVITRFGDNTYACATADVFEANVLTVTFVNPDTGEERPADVFKPDRWLECQVYGIDGYPQFSFRNDPAWAAHVASRELRRGVA